MQKEKHPKDKKDVKASKENLCFEEQNCDKKVPTRLTRTEKIYKLKKEEKNRLDKAETTKTSTGLGLAAQDKTNRHRAKGNTDYIYT